MIRNQKVERMLVENNIEQNNYSLTLKLKKIIEELQARIEHQDAVILSFKRNIKNNKINEMEIEIQHLNDENHRLILLREDTHHRNKSNKAISSKKLYQGNHKKENQGVTVTEFKVESKMSEVLKENQNLRRELLALKVSDSFVKKRTSTINDRNSLVIEKKFVDYEKLQQNKMDLEAERSILTSKISKLQTKVTTLTSRNEQLQKLHYMQLHLSNPAE